MALGKDVQMTNAHYDAIRCPECHRRFDRIEKLNQHKLAKGHWAAHEHLEIFGDNQRRLKMTDNTEENVPTEEVAQEAVVTQQANQPQADPHDDGAAIVTEDKPDEEQPREDAKDVD